MNPSGNIANSSSVSLAPQLKTPVVSTPVTPAGTKNAASLAQGGNGIVGGTYVATPTVQGTQNSPKPVEQTVISSGNINDKVIPDDQSRLASLSSKGSVTGPNGPVLADGSVDTNTLRQQGGFYTADNGQKYFNYDSSPYTESSAFTPDQQSTFDQLQSNLDATTKQSLDAARYSHDNALKLQQDANQRNQTATTASLLANGTSRYAPDDASTYLNAITKDGLDKITQLDSEENRLIAQANQAQGTGEAEILSKKLDLIEEQRKEKQAAVDKLTDQINAHAEDLQTQKEQADKDSAITQQIAKGVTDPNDIIKNLQDAGNKTVSAKDIATTLSNLNPQQSAIVDLLKTAKNNGAPDDVIAKIGQAQSLDAAMVAAGNYAASGTGIVGEYNYAKANGYTGSFSQYQNEDANRKAKATASTGSAFSNIDTSTMTPVAQAALVSNGFSSLNSTTQSLAEQLATGQIAPSELSKRTTGTSPYNDVIVAADKYTMATTGKHFNMAQADRDYKFAQQPATQTTLNYLTSLAGSDDGTGNLSGGNLDELVSLSNQINRTSFPALNDAKAWAKLATGDVKIAQYQAVATEVADQVAKILQGGGSGGSSDAKLQQATNLFNTGFSKDQLSGVVDSLKPLLVNRAKSMIGDNPYLSDYADQFGLSPKSSTADSIVADDKAAVGALQEFDSADPKNSNVLEALHTAFPNASALQIYQKLQSRGLIQ